MEKHCTFLGATEAGPVVLPLFNTQTDSYFEKTASVSLLPEVRRYIETIEPNNKSQWTLNIALGASEWWGANVNADLFPEAGLVHAPPGWSGDAKKDRVLAKDWAYGFPTFYNAHVFKHHQNKKPEVSFGDIEFVAWNPHMKRVEQIIRNDHDRCLKFGAIAIWDKLQAGEYLDLSMGCKVPYDTCTYCLDVAHYNRALATFDPKKHKHPGEAVVEIYRTTQKKVKDEKGNWVWVGKGAIRGVAITRKDYCRHMLEAPNRIMPNGVRVAVNNDFPRFFDQSWVFIGADRTSKTLAHITPKVKHFFLGYSAGEETKAAQARDYETSYFSFDSVKTAASLEDFLGQKIAALPKQATIGKRGEITKDVLPPEMAKRMAGPMSSQEMDLDDDMIRNLGHEKDLPRALGTAARCGIVLRPREFQRVMLIQIGRPGLAHSYDESRTIFPRVEECEDFPLSSDTLPELLAKLIPMMAARSCFGPAIEPRAIMSSGRLHRREEGHQKRASSQTSELLSKLGATYNGYRNSIMSFLATNHDAISQDYPVLGGVKVASSSTDRLLTSLSHSYLADAFWSETDTSRVKGDR